VAQRSAVGTEQHGLGNAGRLLSIGMLLNSCVALPINFLSADS